MSDSTTPAVSPFTDPAAALADPKALASSAGSGTAPNPLDVLDQILNEAQDKAGEAIAAREKAEAQKIQEELDRKREADKQKIAQEIANVTAMKQSPQYQARVEQDQKEEKQEEEKAEKLEGMEIVQVAHGQI
jgi:hypothetical protein